MKKKSIYLLLAILLCGNSILCARSASKYIKLYNKKINEVHEKIKNMGSMEAHEIRQIITSFESVEKKIKDSKKDVKQADGYNELVKRLDELRVEVDKVRIYVRVAGAIDEYNYNIDEWKSGKNGSATPYGWISSMKSKMGHGITMDYEVTVKTGTFTIAALINDTKQYIDSNITTVIAKRHESLKAKSQAKQLYEIRGEPDFTNHYGNENTSYILWVYNYTKAGSRYQDIYHLNPETGEIVEQWIGEKMD